MVNTSQLKKKYDVTQRKGWVWNYVETKAKVILFKTFVKVTFDKDYLGFRLMISYCQVRGSYLLNSFGHEESSIFTPPFYKIAIDILRITVKIPEFPIVSVKFLYQKTKYKKQENLHILLHIYCIYPFFF